LQAPARQLATDAKQARASADHNTVEADRKILNSLNAVGFSHYISPVTFISNETHTKQLVKDKLREVPGDVADQVANFVATVDDGADMTEKYTYSNGQGALTVVKYRVQTEEGRKAVAMLVYGTTFDLAKVVEHYETQVVQHPVFAEQVHEVAGGWFSNGQRRVEKVMVGTTKEVRKIPVFKQGVMDMEKQNALKRALEHQANEQVVRVLGLA